MEPSDYLTVAEFGNDTSSDMRVYLEMTCEEVVIGPGQSIALLARPSAGLLPITVHRVDDGLQVFPHKEFDPDWHVRFKGKVFKPGHPSLLSDHE
jgi:hypothetical protein